MVLNDIQKKYIEKYLKEYVDDIYENKRDGKTIKDLFNFMRLTQAEQITKVQLYVQELNNIDQALINSQPTRKAKWEADITERNQV